MFAMGINDIIAIITGCIICGYYSLMGFSYCDNPRTSIIVGHFAQGNEIHINKDYMHIKKVQ